MWKLNKSIAKDCLPTQPVDFPIEPWWGVCLVNFTLEEFKVRYLLKRNITKLFFRCVNLAIRNYLWSLVRYTFFFTITISFTFVETLRSGNRHCRQNL